MCYTDRYVSIFGTTSDADRPTALASSKQMARPMGLVAPVTTQMKPYYYPRQRLQTSSLQVGAQTYQLSVGPVRRELLRFGHDVVNAMPDIS